ncbi:hypothetical protein BZL30_9448 [Mycobacterium kansasii]|uniref:Uncharacterized protein n=1 Tax=Mycobacterium kansasii TaxID=1768 RepID=A0A1V3W9S1_MYCKA|nr:hypothetical protein BZL30_9448 [Mycobacterium kansasii]
MEVTARGGTVVRGEACADSFYAASSPPLANWRTAAPQQRPPQSSLRRQDAVSLAEATAAARTGKGLRRGAGRAARA